jgi:hypothetical protein
LKVGEKVAHIPYRGRFFGKEKIQVGGRGKREEGIYLYIAGPDTVPFYYLPI